MRVKERDCAGSDGLLLSGGRRGLRRAAFERGWRGLRGRRGVGFGRKASGRGRGDVARIGAVCLVGIPFRSLRRP